MHTATYVCISLLLMCTSNFLEHLRASVLVGECVCLWACVCVCVCVCVTVINVVKREVAAESDGSSARCRLSLRGGTLLHPTREGQLRVIGSLVLGGEFPPSHAFKQESRTEGKEKGDEREDKQRGRKGWWIMRMWSVWKRRAEAEESRKKRKEKKKQELKPSWQETSCYFVLDTS